MAMQPNASIRVLQLIVCPGIGGGAMQLTGMSVDATVNRAVPGGQLVTIAI